VVALACLALSACGSYVTRGRYLYREGRYIESAEVLARHERELVGESPRRQAEYAIYRGLSNLVLGNFPEAQRWMGFAYELERRFPGALRPEHKLELDQGWWELTMRLGPRPTSGAAPSSHARQ
jgi:hypothetical protein